MYFKNLTGPFLRQKDIPAVRQGDMVCQPVGRGEVVSEQIGQIRLRQAFCQHNRISKPLDHTQRVCLM